MNADNKIIIGGLSEELIMQIIDTINSTSKPKRIILYGSRARDDYYRTSDIDLAIENVSSTYIIKDALEEQVNTLLFFDVVNLDSVCQRLQQRILTEGKVLYEQ
jgi:predicted nucleotidyltransferase